MGRDNYKNQEGRNSQSGSENEEKSILMCYWYLWNKVKSSGLC